MGEYGFARESALAKGKAALNIGLVAHPSTAVGASVVVERVVTATATHDKSLD